MNLNCIIVDDEPIARDILKSYIGQIPYLTLTAECRDALEAMQVLKEDNIDIVFLDIRMPRLTGLEMLRSLRKYPSVIITSAFPEHALEGFELSVVDYLLKPFSFPRFVQAIEKVAGQANRPPVHPAQPEDEKFLMIKSDKKLAKVFLKEIVYIEAYGNYIFIYRQGDRIMSKQTLSGFEEQLPASRFVRIHKSYIVAITCVKFLEGNEVSVGSTKLPVGRAYRETLMTRLQ